jgi:hypothetical protein
VITCKEYDESREKLSELIFSLKSFTEEELESRFREIRGSKIEIGRKQTIHDYLDELRELGALSFEFGHYCVQDRTLMLA